LGVHAAMVVNAAVRSNLSDREGFAVDDRLDVSAAADDNVTGTVDSVTICITAAVMAASVVSVVRLHVERRDFDTWVDHRRCAQLLNSSLFESLCQRRHRRNAIAICPFSLQ